MQVKGNTLGENTYNFHPFSKMGDVYIPPNASLTSLLSRQGEKRLWKKKK
jgi:hypothetical protein